MEGKSNKGQACSCVRECNSCCSGAEMSIPWSWALVCCCVPARQCAWLPELWCWSNWLVFSSSSLCLQLIRTFTVTETGLTEGRWLWGEGWSSVGKEKRMGCPCSLVKGKAFEVMIGGCNSWCLFFHVSGKQEFAWKQDSKWSTEKCEELKVGRSWLTWYPGGVSEEDAKLTSVAQQMLPQRLSFCKETCGIYYRKLPFWAINIAKVVNLWFGRKNRHYFGKAMSHFWPHFGHILSLLLMQRDFESFAGGANWYIVSSLLFKWPHL